MTLTPPHEDRATYGDECPKCHAKPGYVCRQRQWGGEDQPLIWTGDKYAPHTRVSSLCKLIDDNDNLIKWKSRKVLEGVLYRPDLMSRTAGAIANGDPDSDQATKRKLDAIAREAQKAAKSDQGSSAGTGLHEFTEAMDKGVRGITPWHQDAERLRAYCAAMQPYEVLDVETFVVNDEVQAAGTFDRLVRCPDGAVRVADLKTGKSEADYPAATAIQLATYANADRYDVETGERTPLHGDLDLTTALLIHMPPSGGCTVIPLNIERGWNWALVAADVRDFRRLKAADWRVSA